MVSHLSYERMGAMALSGFRGIGICFWTAKVGLPVYVWGKRIRKFTPRFRYVKVKFRALGLRLLKCADLVER